MLDLVGLERYVDKFQLLGSGSCCLKFKISTKTWPSSIGFENHSYHQYSLALALNSLGYPTLHTYKLYENSDIIDMWTEKVFLPSIESNEFKLGNPDFDLITSHGFVGALDFPIALYFEQLNEIYPDCKFILTERENSEIWYESWRSMVISVSQTTNLGAGILKHVNQLSLYFR